MIRLYSKLCKYFNKNSIQNDVDIFNKYMKNVNIHNLSCPFCGSKHSLTTFATYERHLVTYHNKKSTDNRIIITRCKCSSCGHTHAILPTVIVPYMSFSFNFTVSIIYDYLTHNFKSIEAMCNHYGISISTFYRIFKEFKVHKQLWLGILEDKLISNLTFITQLLNSDSLEIETFIINFFNKIGISFFQRTS